MIHYALRCGAAHEFDGWFASAAAFDDQSRRGLLECPACGAATVTRALMAPAVPRKSRRAGTRSSAEPDIIPPERPAPDRSAVRAGSDHPGPAPAGQAMAVALPAAMRAVLQRIRSEVERTCDYVGPAFAEEARRIHDGDAEARAIYGEATPDEAEALRDDGIDIASIPWVPLADA